MSGKAPCNPLCRLWLLACFCLSSPAGAQYRFDVWTAEDGLPQNVIRGICQTPDGYLWLATLDGVARFEGVRFTVFNKSNSPGIDSNRFSSLYEDRNSDLWLGTEGGGVTRRHNGRFTTYTTKDGVPGNTVLAITGDESGNLWISSSDAIARWREAAGRFVDITPQDLRIQFASFLWEKPGFCGWDPRGLHCFIAGRFVTYPLPRGFPASSIWGAARDSGRDDLAGKRRWQATRIREGRTRIEPVTAGRGATAAYRDRNGHSWTFSVLGRLLRSVNRSFSGRVETVSFSSVYEDREGNLWLTTEGQKLYRLRSQSIRVYSREEGLIDRNVYPIGQDRSGAIWIGAWQTGLSRLQGEKFTS